MADDPSVRYEDLLTGSYDCVDRIVLNAYHPLGHNPGAGSGPGGGGCTAAPRSTWTTPT